MGVSTLTTCDLVIVGADAGINAFVAACKYLRRGARVVVVDRGTDWGGQWVEQYSYVRLHQPYLTFTAGDHPWSIAGTKPPGHLATKGEILQYFRDAASASVEERAIDLSLLFLHSGECVEVVGQRVRLRARPLPALGPDAPVVMVHADRMINCAGFNIARKLPLRFSTSARVHSLCPGDVLNPAWTSLTEYSQDSDKEIIVVGSGKTAMDVVYHLCRKPASSKMRSRIRMIAGRGTWFLKRELAFPTDWWELHRPGLRTSADSFFDCLEFYDGTNACETALKMSEAGFFHSAVPDPRSFALGICSEQELDVVREALRPTQDRVFKGHLVDIVDIPNGSHGPSPRLKIRELDGQSFVYRDIAPGTIIINATDNLSESSNMFSPVVDESGLVLSPQYLCGFTGPSANLATHAWFAGILDGLWQRLPRLMLEVMTKEKAGIHLMACVFLSTAIVESALQRCESSKYRKNTNSNLYPMYRLAFTGIRAARTFRGLVDKYAEIMRERFTDEEQYIPKELGILGGNAGLARL